MNNLIKRFAAFYIDGIFIVVLTYVMYFASHYFTADFNWNQDIDFNELAIYQLTSYFTYFFSLELIWKTTIGKMILKFKVDFKKNYKFMWWSVFVRTFMRLFPFNAISFLFSNEKIFWHEALSNSKTVNAKKIQQ